jgi:hypothetical protein
VTATLAKSKQFGTLCSVDRPLRSGRLRSPSVVGVSRAGPSAVGTGGAPPFLQFCCVLLHNTVELVAETEKALEHPAGNARVRFLPLFISNHRRPTQPESLFSRPHAHSGPVPRPHRKAPVDAKKHPRKRTKLARKRMCFVNGCTTARPLELDPMVDTRQSCSAHHTLNRQPSLPPCRETVPNARGSCSREKFAPILHEFHARMKRVAVKPNRNS